MSAAHNNTEDLANKKANFLKIVGVQLPIRNCMLSKQKLEKVARLCKASLLF